MPIGLCAVRIMYLQCLAEIVDEQLGAARPGALSFTVHTHFAPTAPRSLQSPYGVRPASQAQWRTSRL